MAKRGRPKGTISKRPRNESVRIPLTASEKQFLEQCATTVQANLSEFSDTSGTVPVLRTLLLKAANEAMQSFSGAADAYGAANPYENPPTTPTTRS